MKYQFMDRESRTVEHAIWPVVVMCRVLEVHRSGYYAWQHRQLTKQLGKRAQENKELTEAIREIHRNSKERYGAPRVTAELHRQGFRCSHNRVARLMKASAIKAKRRRAYRVTTRSNHPLASPNLLDRNFTAQAQDRVWTSDITYVKTREGWIYVATVMYLFSRKIVGLAMRNRMSKELVCDALKQAIMHRRPEPGLLLHSDRGSQYSSWSYREIIHANGFKQSMSRKGNCWDNAPMESFFKTMKVEEVYRRKYQTREEARQSIFEYIEIFYNRQRLHSTLGYETPESFEAQSITENHDRV
jgi:transposase InsO family protein